ncbi:uncharacterized protein LOC123292261 isoform X1 [Chrysoperla carnea]|uniref:uncharacterized protein LOC123292261 isoform X1 n=1 Tax=Chrysoperla carnea TaxID=189513 RepID=UPI001D084A12|nr:uncharacterized protein LOC123292261 isoform X1 [Chrysoperla carnea]XP_044728773.1 uncharacterized protein LOC123292261 isoform X1 [Chrysoperla carnea]XP_044728774.1 uncharacterized protein LOC123292261 isoform X1 [Chrysoperla carnea]
MVNCQVDKCGCGCTLRTGTIIIGVYNLMGSIILFITCVWIQNNPHLLEEFDENGNNIPEEEESNRTTLTTSMIISFIHFWTSVSLLLGVDKRKRSLLQVWVVYAVLFAIYAIIDNLSDTPAKMFTDDISGGVGILFQTAIIGALWIYSIIIVTSYSKQIKFGQDIEQQDIAGQRSYVSADNL